MVITRSERIEVPQSVKSHGIFGSAESGGSSVTCDGAISHIIRCLCSDEEAITTDHRVCSERGALMISSDGRNEINGSAYLENVKEGTRVKAGLLVDGTEGSRLGLGAVVRVKGGGQVQLETFCNLVLNLDLGAQDIGGSPSLSESEAILGVKVLGLDVTVYDGGLGVACAGDLDRERRKLSSDLKAKKYARGRDLESNIRRRLSLDFEGVSVDGEVLSQQIVRAFAQILEDV